MKKHVLFSLISLFSSNLFASHDRPYIKEESLKDVEGRTCDLYEKGYKEACIQIRTSRICRNEEEFRLVGKNVVMVSAEGDDVILTFNYVDEKSGVNKAKVKIEKFEWGAAGYSNSNYYSGRVIEGSTIGAMFEGRDQVHFGTVRYGYYTAEYWGDGELNNLGGIYFYQDLENSRVEKEELDLSISSYKRILKCGYIK